MADPRHKTRPNGTRPVPLNRRTSLAPRRARVAWSVSIGGFVRGVHARLGWLPRIGLALAHVALAVFVILVLVFSGKLIEQHLRNAPGFATSEIEMEGLARLTRADVERIAGIGVGKNIFDTNAEEALARLRAEPWIASADVRRRLPGSYTVQIVERKAIALLALDELYLVSDEGLAFKKLGPGDPSDLPLITGIDLDAIAEDRTGSGSALAGAIALLNEYTAAGLAKREVLSEIHIEPDATLSCYVGKDGMYVRLGKPPYKNKLRRLREVISQLGSQSARASYVYLDNEKRPDRVTVKLR